MKNITEGTKVLVSNGGRLKERIYLFTNENGLHICVHNNDVAEYEAGRYFRVGVWSVLEEIDSPVESIARFGTTVLVSNGGEVFRPRIYLGNVGGKVLVVHKEDEVKFKSGALNYRTALWNEARV